LTQNNAPLAIPSSPRPGDVVSFGTDGWRAIIGEDFNTENLARLACAIAVVYDQEASKAGNLGSSDTAKSEANSDTISDKTSQTIRSSTFYIGYDCRENAGRYAAFAAQIIAGASGLSVIVSDSYCPTPALCWTVARDPDAIGGIMLTSSHNPAEYLGVKLRMADGGASPKQFSDSVEEIMRVQLPKTSATHGLPFNYEHALRVAQVAINATPDCRAVLGQTVTRDDQLFSYRDIVSPYIAALRKTVDAKSIAAAKLRVVVDPMYGAGRGFLARLLESLGV
jgi:phosphomannomutase